MNYKNPDINWLPSPMPDEDPKMSCLGLIIGIIIALIVCGLLSSCSSHKEMARAEQHRVMTMAVDSSRTVSTVNYERRDTVCTIEEVMLIAATDSMVSAVVESLSLPYSATAPAVVGYRRTQTSTTITEARCDTATQSTAVAHVADSADYRATDVESSHPPENKFPLWSRYAATAIALVLLIIGMRRGTKK